MKKNRFKEFNPSEKTIMRVLMQNHANTVSEIALFGTGDRVRITPYLAMIEALEDELMCEIEEGTPISEIRGNLTSMTYNSLTEVWGNKPSIETIEQLCEYSEEKLLEIEGLGKRGVSDIRRALGHLGLILKQKI